MDDLVKNVLLEERLGMKCYQSDKYTMRWTLANDAGVVFVVVFQSFLASRAAMFDELLRRVKKKFMATFGGMIQNTT